MKVDQVIDILLNSSDESESLENSDDENVIIEEKKETHSQSSFKTSKDTQTHKEEIKTTNKVSSKKDEKEETNKDNKKKIDLLSTSDSSDDSDDSDDLPLGKLILKKGLNTSKPLNNSSSHIITKPSATIQNSTTISFKSSSKTKTKKSIFKRRSSMKKEQQISCMLKGIYDFNDELIQMSKKPNDEVSFVYSDLEDEPSLNWDSVDQTTNEISAYLDSDSESENNKENLNSIYNSLNCSPAIALEKSDKYILSLKNLKRKKSFNY